MKKLFFATLFLFSITIIAQELDEAYLNSLPDEIRQDVLDTVESKKAEEDPVYRRASTMIDKNDDEDDEDDRIFSLYGSEFFDTMQTTFMPTNEPNLDGSYTLDYGDELEIQLVGQKNETNSFVIKRDGSISINDVGKINLSGLSFDEAAKFIKEKIGSIFIGTQAFVSLKNVRDIQVLITGNAFNPGIYTLSGNSNVFFAIAMAGGISEFGSYRNINLIRNNEIIQNIDLYDIFINGKTNFGNSLKSGDSILIKPLSNVINIISGVNRPGYYELKEGESLEDVFQFANGISSNADLNSIQIQRLNKSKIDIKSIDKKNISSTLLFNNDSITIKEFKYGDVLLEGAIKLPGTYKIIQGDTLKDLIIRAGGYEDYAYPFGGYLENKQTKDINRIARERLYDTFLKNLIDSASSQFANGNDSLTIILNQLRNVEDTGRVVAEFDIAAIEANSKLDTILEDGDRILIPIITNQIYIYGEVNNQGAVRYSENKDLDYYIKSAGGSLKSADPRNIFVVHPNGVTKNLNTKQSRLSFLNPIKNDIDIYPGSIIYIPRRADLASSTQIASIWAPIISSFALSVASISALNNN